MQCIHQFQDILKRAEELTKDLLSENGRESFAKDKQLFEAQLQRSKYIKVPIVGVFSAGKSTLLNAFTQRPGMLPVDTLPETAVAYELYYDTNERVELYREEKLQQTCELSAIKSLSTQPGDVAKVYCTSAVVKSLQDRGVVLVDMPGIGSGIEQHEAAVANYIDEGTAFVLMVDAEHGTLRADSLEFLASLKAFELYPAVFLTKADKKPAKEVEEIKDVVTYQLKKISEAAPTVSVLSAVDDSYQAFHDYVFSLDADAMVHQKFGEKLKAVLDKFKGDLAMRVDLRQKDVAKVDEVLAAIDKEIANAKQHLPQTNSQADTPEKSTQDILDGVAEALRAKVPTFAQMLASRQSVESVQSVMVSTVNAQIRQSFKEESEQYVNAVGSALNEASKQIAAISLDGDFMKNYGDVIDIVKMGIPMFPIGGKWIRILKKLLMCLPLFEKVINRFFGKSAEDIRAEIQRTLDSQIPTIVNELRSSVLKLVSDNQQRISQAMQQQYTDKLNSARDGLTEKKNDASKNKAEVEAELQKLQQAIADLDGIIASL